MGWRRFLGFFRTGHHRFFSHFAFILLGIFHPAHALDLDPYPVDRFTREPLSFSIYREERPSFYWVNTGVPDAFFNNITQTSNSVSLGGTLSYEVQNITYGLHASGWIDSHLQLRATLPFEANALSDSAGVTHNQAQFGDLEVASTYLFVGRREGGNFVGVNGWFRFATGTNPFTQTYPLLASGKGARSGALGLEMRQEVDGFSFFESLNYEKSEAISLPATSPLGSGSFQWPDTVHALGRMEWLAFHRGQRFITLFYELRMRKTGFMTLNGQPLPYAYGENTAEFFYSSLGLTVRVDKALTVEGQGTYVPFDPLGFRLNAPDSGILFSMSVSYRAL